MMRSALLIVVFVAGVAEAKSPYQRSWQRFSDASSCNQAEKAQCHATFNTKWALCGAGASDSETTKEQCRASVKEEAKACLELAGCSD